MDRNESEGLNQRLLLIISIVGAVLAMVGWLRFLRIDLL